MCIIAYKPAGVKMFTDSQIRTMFTNNPDGAGYMYYDLDTHQTVYRKGFMTAAEFIRELQRQDFTDTNLILHFRIGTSGLMDGLNCHPFPVYSRNSLEGSGGLCVAHNGILKDYEPSWKSQINDTQVFIRKVLSRLDEEFIYDDDKIFLLSKIIGSNKLAFLNDKNNVRLIGDFIERDGCYYSNYSFIARRHTFCDTDDIWEYLDTKQ